MLKQPLHVISAEIDTLNQISVYDVFDMTLLLNSVSKLNAVGQTP
jgi:hypothetical protein